MSTFQKTFRTIFHLTDSIKSSLSPFLAGEGIKLLFDHLRNITLCAFIGQVGVIARYFGENSKASHLIAISYGYIFLGLAILCFILNWLHGEHLLRMSPHFETVRKSKYFGVIEKTYWLLYVLVVIPTCFFSLFESIV